MDIKKNDVHRHCSEVEKLLVGKMPFVTRYGITIIALIIFFIISILLSSEGTPQRLMKGMIEHTIEQITSKKITNNL